MSADESSEHGDAGIFGSLPDSRPGVRSPRRGGTERGDDTKDEAPPAAASAPEPEPPPPPPPPPPPRDPEPPAPESKEGQRGIEELAWAGVTAAAEAATIGVRLATRALEAARKATERQ
jgi:hypothetical protein